MSLIDDVREYETWLRERCAVDEAGLRKKHKRMVKDPFIFFRATCFRFARTIDGLVSDLKRGPVVPTVGDAHIENWGTWRDGDGRLVWGVNDFDDAALLPYAYDLVRLATSARLAPGLPGQRRDRSAQILGGYAEGLARPAPIFADDTKPWLQGLVSRPATKTDAFTLMLDGLDPADPPPPARTALSRALPTGATLCRYATRRVGGGALGRPRYLAIARWQGGRIVRESKAIVPSAWDWAAGRAEEPHLLERVAAGAYRAPDPFLHLGDGYIVRRLAPDSAKIDLAEDEAAEFGAELLANMGADLAAIHASEGASGAIAADLAQRPKGWLHEAAKAAGAAVEQDFEAWVAHRRP